MQRRTRNSLNFLIDTSGQERPEAQPLPTGPIVTAAVQDLTGNPWQPRQDFDDQKIRELAESIRQHGVVQPIVVRQKVGGGFQIVAGERRWRAALLAGLKEVPIVLRNIDDDNMLAVALVENIQRQDLGPIERARAFRRLAEERGLSHAKLAEISGLSRSTVSNCLRLLDLEIEIQDALRDTRLTEGHARTLLAERDPVRRGQLFQEMIGGELTVRDAEDRVSKAKGEHSPRAKNRRKSHEARELERSLAESLGIKVVIHERGSKGRVELFYSSLEEFDHIYKSITGQPPSLA